MIFVKMQKVNDNYPLSFINSNKGFPLMDKDENLIGVNQVFAVRTCRKDERTLGVFTSMESAWKFKQSILLAIKLDFGVNKVQRNFHKKSEEFPYAPVDLIEKYKQKVATHNLLDFVSWRINGGIFEIDIDVFYKVEDNGDFKQKISFDKEEVETVSDLNILAVPLVLVRDESGKISNFFETNVELI